MEKNHKSQGITAPPCVGFGEATEVVTGIRKPASEPEDVVVALSLVVALSVVCGVMLARVIVVEWPFGRTVVKRCPVRPVGRVIIPFVLAMTVSDAESTSVTASSVAVVLLGLIRSEGVIIVVFPFGKVVLIAVVTPLGMVTLPLPFEITVCEAELTYVVPNSEEVQVIENVK